MKKLSIKHWALGVALTLGVATTHGATVPEILAKDQTGLEQAQAAGLTLEALATQEEAAKVAKQLATREARLLEHYRNKLKAQLERLKAAEVGIEAEREALRQVRLETGPLMDEMNASLRRLVDADLPFLSAERQARLAQLDRVMADPTIDDGRRMDVLLDAFQVELTYGLTVGAENGTNEAGEWVTYLRLGRLGYFALSPNKKTAMRYVDGRWVAVDPEDVEPLLRVREVALGKALPDVLLVPERVLPRRVKGEFTHNPNTQGEQLEILKMKAKRMMTYVRSSLVLGLALGVMQANSATLSEVYRDVVRETQAEIAVAKEAVVTQREATKAMVKDQQTAEKAKQALAQDVAQLEADLMAAQARVKAARAVLEQEKAGTQALFDTLDRHERLMKDALLKTPLGIDVAPLIDTAQDVNGKARLDRFKTHWLATMKAIVASGEVTHFENVSIFDVNGNPLTDHVTRFGAFGALGQKAGWLSYMPQARSWQALSDVPQFDVGFVGLDPTYGERLTTYNERHSSYAWLKPAGFVGVLIGIVALVALMLGILRWWRLTQTLREVRLEAERETPDETNPLGRLRVAATEESDELLEARLDAALVAERPRLNRGISMLAVLAGIPTLLGLLGTVSGMIETFGVMSAHGSAEPGLLAGGIAEALITTELGLITAIPILLLHCAVKNRRDAVISTLEEAAATLAVREAHGCCGACHHAGNH